MYDAFVPGLLFLSVFMAAIITFGALARFDMSTGVHSVRLCGILDASGNNMLLSPVLRKYECGVDTPCSN